jgi:hypothetical protein
VLGEGDLVNGVRGNGVSGGGDTQVNGIKRKVTQVNGVRGRCTQVNGVRGDSPRLPFCIFISWYKMVEATVRTMLATPSCKVYTKISLFSFWIK